MSTTLSHLELLEAESIHMLREVVAESGRCAMLYSIGKDSSVLLRLAQKAFYPGRIPFPLLHIDTGFKFTEMIEFRDRTARELGLELLAYINEDAKRAGTNPFQWGPSRCCALLKTRALLDALATYRIETAIGGARRDEEKSRAKERAFSVRDTLGQWDPKNQRPEFWNLYNGRVGPGQGMRVFPLSNWTESDIWEYIRSESIPVVPLYFAKEREVLVRGDFLLPLDHPIDSLRGETPQRVMCRMRSLGCTYCTGAIRSSAATVDEIIEELKVFRSSERENRVIDHDQEGSMELKKIEGYF